MKCKLEIEEFKCGCGDIHGEQVLCVTHDEAFRNAVDLALHMEGKPTRSEEQLKKMVKSMEDKVKEYESNMTKEERDRREKVFEEFDRQMKG